MKHIDCRILTPDLAETGMEEISAFFDLQDRQYIDRLSWDTGGHKPEVSFAMAHDKAGIYLKYWVKEMYVRAIYKNINDPVYKDSCVEAFLSFNGDANYYNLEFNYTGVVLGGYGPGKQNRREISEKVLSQIQILSDIKAQDAVTRLYHWELTLFFPFSIFIHQRLGDLPGRACRANFYKCGDELQEPHFLTWAPIVHPYPEFHLPDFFGTIAFV
ncbi:MAG: carbohydrate-binding family 9-like protein [Bacteroidota bacterium]|nr:carbohydrate-binding family 9-like protein [Bacteroidota bacterium]